MPIIIRINRGGWGGGRIFVHSKINKNSSHHSAKLGFGAEPRVTARRNRKGTRLKPRRIGTRNNTFGDLLGRRRDGEVVVVVAAGIGVGAVGHGWSAKASIVCFWKLKTLEGGVERANARRGEEYRLRQKWKDKWVGVR